MSLRLEVVVSACLAVFASGCLRADVPLGAADVVVFGRSLATEPVTRVVVTISGPGLGAPLSKELVASQGAWRGVLGELPAGPHRRFEASALDANGIALFEGRAEDVDVPVGSPVSVSIVLQQRVGPDPFRNSPPVLETFTVSPGVALPGATVAVSVVAWDPDPGDSLTFAWTADAGTYQRASDAATTWTAPVVEGEYELRITISDTRGAARILRAAMVVSSDPNAAPGGAPVLNTAPELLAFGVDPTVVAPGGTTQLHVRVRDDDGDAVTVAYADDCGGTFFANGWRAPLAVSSAACLLRATADDGHGAQAARTARVDVSAELPRNRPPALSSRSAISEEFDRPGTTLRLEVAATDADADAVVFDWSASSGQIAEVTSTSTASRIEWTAADGDATITVRALDGAGASDALTFVRARRRAPRPVVTSLDPQSVVVGTTEVIIRLFGSDFVEPTVVRLDGQPLVTTLHSPSELSFRLPAALRRAARVTSVIVENPEPSQGPSVPFAFFIANPTPSISSVSPSDVGAGAAAIRLTIEGSDFQPGAQVLFDRIALATTLESTGGLVALLPSSATAVPGYHSLRVENPDPDLGASAEWTFTVRHPIPVITALAPDRVRLSGLEAQVLRVHGSAFTPGSSVRVAGLAVPTAHLSDDELEVTILPDVLSLWGDYPVVVESPAPATGPSLPATLHVEPPPSHAETISAGGYSSCSLGQGGTVACAGANHHGALGDGTTQHRAIPAQISGLVDMVQVTVGGLHACALGRDGLARCWGWNRYGQLGDGTAIDRPTPTLVAGLSGLVELVASSERTCARDSMGRVWCWGRNHVGQLGDGSTIERRSPVELALPRPAVGLAVLGEYHGCALTIDATAVCWGSNTDGQLGDGTTLDRATPASVPGLSGATRLFTRGYGTYAITSDGRLWSWGRNDHGELGDGTTIAARLPQLVAALTDVVALGGTTSGPCALRSTADVWCWGTNGRGNLGDGTTVDRLAPRVVAGLGPIVELSGGEDHVLVRARDGSVHAWGGNQFGQLGDGSLQDRWSATLSGY
ncbi:hypothetical protein L6R52_03735 [Myxococcota bacterium]|nr:hypothetical protein [Myxococcota bacterium]